MIVFAKIQSELIQISCKDGARTLRWLGEESWRKYQKLSKGIKIEINDDNSIIKEIRKSKEGALLDPDDTISDVLENNDCVDIVLTDSPSHNEAYNFEDFISILEPVVHMENQAITKKESVVVVDGCSLTPNVLVNLGTGNFKIKLSDGATHNVQKSRAFVETFLHGGVKHAYGINTGIGSLANVRISTEKLKELQYNIITSHSSGVGNPLSLPSTRMLLALRINVLAKGYSGISLKTLQGLIDAFNVSCLSWVPEQGSVGASGDLAPLSHLALGLLGEGKMWSPKTGWDDAAKVLSINGLEPLVLEPKEGIALINGTQLITSIGAEAVERALNIAKQADIIAALSVEVLKGTTRAFDVDIHLVRPHKGQISVAQRLRSLTNSNIYPSKIAESHKFCGRIQDSYTLRCCPQVHGIVHDTIEFVKHIITTEMNSATDNPIVFADREEIISAGNFHGEYPGKALDFLCIAVHELSSMSEKRTERMMNPVLSGLPTYLVHDSGLNSGFMLTHHTAAALVSENKVLCHPSTVDSISTSLGQEDHVSMGCFAARKCLQVIENVEHVLAIELLASCQALEFLRPLKSTAPLEEVYKTVRSVVKPLDKDRVMTPDIQAVKKLLVENKIWHAALPHMTFYDQESKTRIPSHNVTTEKVKSVKINRAQLQIAEEIPREL